MKGHTTALQRLPGSGRRVKRSGSILRANEQLLKNFVVTYRNKSGDMTTKTSHSTGPDNHFVKAQFEARGYQVISVVYKGFAGGSVQTG
jgi:hypothetical protein